MKRLWQTDRQFDDMKVQNDDPRPQHLVSFVTRERWENMTLAEQLRLETEVGDGT